MSRIYITKLVKSDFQLFSLRSFSCTSLRKFHFSNVNFDSNFTESNTLKNINIKLKDKPNLDELKSNNSTLEIKLDIENNELSCINPTNSVNLRAYQKECIDAIKESLSSGKENKIAISIATGGGKTVIFCMAIPEILKMARFKGDKANGILILVHRRELAKQTINTLQKLKIVDDDRIFLDMGNCKISPETTFNDSRPFIIVGSVPSLARNGCSRMSEYKLDRFKAVIVDECHHAVSASYINLFETLHCSKSNPDKNGPFLIGFSATLGRADKIPLKKVFDKVVFQKHITSLIEEKHLCDFDWLKVGLGIHLDEVEVQGNDFQLNSLSKHINTPEINAIILKTYLKFREQYPNNTKSLLIFCVNVEHMQTICSLFRANGVNAQYVSGETKNSERDKITSDFKIGKIPVLINCGVFTEGTDIPNIDCIFLLRPTRSKPLLVQMVGRGLRVANGKNKLLVVDFVDNKSVGISVSSTLNGKTDFIKLFGAKNMGGGGIKTIDELLPGDIDYIKFKNYNGLDMLYNETKQKKSMPFQLLKNMKNINMRGNMPIWTHVKFDCWAVSVGYKSYLKIEVTKAGDYKASHCFTRTDVSGRPRLVSNVITENSDFESTFSAIVKYISEHEFVKDGVTIQHSRESSMRNSLPTKAQKKFITETMTPIIESTKSSALNYDKFLNLFDDKINKMSKLEAYQLIFAYTIGRTQSVMLWLKENFLKTKKDRLAITNKSVLDDINAQIESGWH